VECAGEKSGRRERKQRFGINGTIGFIKALPATKSYACYGSTVSGNGGIWRIYDGCSILSRHEEGRFALLSQCPLVISPLKNAIDTLHIATMFGQPPESNDVIVSGQIFLPTSKFGIFTQYHVITSSLESKTGRRGRGILAERQ